jgi:ABC-type dipeptide/oligopeptide/nickel transport system ATPase component
MSASEPLLRVEDLRVEFSTEDGVVHAVDGITYEVKRGGTLGIVGESGSGKTVAAMTTLGLTRGPGASISGRIVFEGRDLLAISEEELRAIRGNEIAMVFQDPLSSLHPFYKVGSQLIEAVRARLPARGVRVRADRLDKLVADAVEGVQRGERVLEDHRDLVAPDRTQLFFGERDEILTAEQDAPGDARALAARETERRQRGDGLARARLADDPKRAPGVHLVGDPVDGVHDPVLGGKLDAQVLDAQQRLGGAHE